MITTSWRKTGGRPSTDTPKVPEVKKPSTPKRQKPKVDVYDDYGNIDEFWDTWSKPNAEITPVQEASNTRSQYRKCAICGKEFFIGNQGYIYKIGTGKGVKYFCGWNHMQTFRKDKT